jgi:ATP-dependent RNA helicase DDX5/DBP2
MHLSLYLSLPVFCLSSWARVSLHAVAFDTTQTHSPPTPCLAQEIEFIEDHGKARRIQAIIRGLNRGDRCICFCKTKRTCDAVTRMLRNDGFPALAIHGDKEQTERDWVLNQFRTGESWVMVATDVAARGIDVDDVKLVVNYDLPDNGVEDYIHRIGRTGRKTLTGYAEGRAISFFSNQNAKIAAELVSVLVESKQEVPPELQRYAQMGRGRTKSRYGGGGGRRGGGGGRSHGGGGGGRSGSNMAPLGGGGGGGGRY